MRPATVAVPFNSKEGVSPKKVPRGGGEVDTAGYAWTIRMLLVIPWMGAMYPLPNLYGGKCIRCARVGSALHLLVVCIFYVPLHLTVLLKTFAIFGRKEYSHAISFFGEIFFSEMTELNTFRCFD